MIITDRLVNLDIVGQHAPEHAILEYAGKQGYSDSSVPQSVTNKNIVRYARMGKRVVRLKGGDVAFFSNVLDELETVVANDIPYEIIPGITAAAGASAYTGIPLTARGISQGVQWLTYNPSAAYPIGKWKSLVEDTTVFYMAVKNLHRLALEILREVPHCANLPLAIIEQATTPFQRVHVTTLGMCAGFIADKDFASPSLVILGNVVGLYDKFRWFDVSAFDGFDGTVFGSGTPSFV